MTLCAACAHEVGAAMAAARAKAPGLESFGFLCPVCQAAYQVGSRGELTLRGNRLETPDLLEDLPDLLEEE